MSDSRVHRVRFYNVQPKAIHCMAYSPGCRKLALSRADSSIEVWNLLHTAFLEKVIPGRGSVESLAWSGKRLFSTGINARVVEHDLKTLTVKHSVPVTAGAAWCLGVNRQGTNLAVGTEDGYINIFSIEFDTLTYEKMLDKQQGRILCLSWDSTGDFIATGSMDTVRIWNVNNGHAVHRIDIGRDESKKETIVWCIAITDDFTVITGDSRGKLSFWNGHTGLNTQTYKSHAADILCLALSEDQSMVYCSGVDPLIATFTKISITSTGTQNGISGAIGAPKAVNQRNQWCRSANRRIHEHDVRAIAVCNSDLCSGGIDSYLAVSRPPKVLVRYPPIPQNPCVMVCDESRSLLLRYTSSLEVWKLGNSGKVVKNEPQNKQGKKSSEGKSAINGSINGLTSKVSESLKLEENPVKVLELKSTHDEHILCSALSADSKWLVEQVSPHLDKVRELPEECKPAHLLKFTSDSSSLILVSQEGQIFSFKLNWEDRRVIFESTLGPDSQLKDTVHLLEISRDSQFVVAGDLQGKIAVWKNRKFYCSLPHYKCVPSALNINPVTNNIVVVYVDHKIIEYSLTRKSIQFTKELDSYFSKQSVSRHFPVTNVTFDPREPDKILLQDDNTINIISKQGRTRDAKTPRRDERSPATEISVRSIKRYKHLIYFGWLSGDESVVVEVSPLRLLMQLPPALYKKRFGV